MSDPIERLSAYRPSQADMDAEWSPLARAHLRVRTLADPVDHSRVRSRLRRQVRSLAPIAACVAVLALITGIVVAVVNGGASSRRGGDLQPGAVGPGTVTAHHHAATLTDTPRVGAHQFAYRESRQIQVGADGKATGSGPDDMVLRDWVAPDGTDESVRSGSQNGCETFGAGGGDFDTQPKLDALPTDPDALKTYLRAHVQGSSSHDEAVFVAVGDMLRTNDLLATTQLRAALVDVLAETAGVDRHDGSTDYLGRAAIRLDFVDQAIRPDEVQSLYFDPSTYQLLEERDGSDGQPSSYGGPSPSYDHSAAQANTPDELTGPAFLGVMYEEKVVDSISADPSTCHGIDGAPNGSGAPAPSSQPS